jgi:AcrR family transcriptional regulator
MSDPSRPRRRAPALPPEERRAAIVEAALPLLAQHGEPITTARIAQAAGIAEGTIFGVFPSKAALIDACLARLFDTAELQSQARRAQGLEALDERLEAIVVALHQHLARILPVTLALGMVGPPTGVSRPQESHLDRLTKIAAGHLQAEVDQASVRGSPKALARILVGLVFGMAFQEAHLGTPIPAPRVLVGTYLDGVRAAPLKGPPPLPNSGRGLRRRPRAD